MDGFDVEIAGDLPGATRTQDVNALRSALTNGGICFNELVLKRKSMDAPSSEALGFFKLALDQGKDWVPVVIAYLVGRMGRKLTVTVDGVSITATSKEEIEKLVPLVDDLRKKAKGKKK